jgi:hypothetical protein
MDMTSRDLAISGILSGSEREIRYGRHVAYGEVSVDGATYVLLHAPTQADFDAVASALDSATPAEIREAIAGPSMVNSAGKMVTAEEI